MQWAEIRQIYPEQWLVVEALVARTEDGQRQLDELAVLKSCIDGGEAMQQYRQLHQQYPEREFYFLHTSRLELDVRERQWLGVRAAYANHVD